jgi:phenylacetate-CoA ligase
MLNASLFLKLLKTKPEAYWQRRGERAALRLFQRMAKTVPAYADFLKKNGARPANVKNAEDFSNLPWLDKENYLRRYSLAELCWSGELKSGQWVFSATSGSTGEPFYFPREDAQDKQYALTAELYLRDNFAIQNHSTLYINGFAMGAWIGGLFTYQALKYVAARGKYRLSTINPGLNKVEILKAVKKLAPQFDLVIIGGYPPFVKDLVDAGLAEGIRWQDYNLRFIFSAEGFNEDFRDYIIRKTGLKNPYKDTLNHYGIVDLGTVAHETPLSILVRRLAVKNPRLYREIFGETHKLPTLAQYLPEFFYFEEKDGNLFCSAASGLPLFRYNLKDRGGMLTLAEMRRRFQKGGLDLDEEVKKVGLADSVWNLPFVYVYERSDFAVSHYGANIYPETVRKAIQHRRLEDFVTGKCVLEIQRNQKQDPELLVHVELKPRARATLALAKSASDLILAELLRENSEYRNNYEQMGKRILPKIVLQSYEHPEYFRPDGKQRWIKN